MPTVPKTRPNPGGRSPKISRREFAGLAALVAVLPVESRLFSGHTSELSAEEQGEVEAQLANILRKYGKRLDGSQRERLRRILEHNQAMLRAIRSFPLRNGDAPASVLRVSQARGRGAGGTS